MLALAGCSDGSNADSSTPTTRAAIPSTTTTTTTIGETESTTTLRPAAGVSTEFPRTIVELDGIPLTVAVANTNEQRARGLMGVEDLGPLDGMLFAFDNEAVRSFWMKDTLIPLDIAFFDAEGFLVGKTMMETCPDGTCPTYSSGEAAQYALEAPAGALAGLAEGARLVLIGGLDGSGKEI